MQVTKAKIDEIPCIFPASREFGFRDEFAPDCPLQRGVLLRTAGVPATEGGRATAERSPFHSPGSGRPSSASRANAKTKNQGVSTPLLLTMTAPVASGGSEIAGWAFHPLERCRLSTAHTQSGLRARLAQRPVFDHTNK